MTPNKEESMKTSNATKNDSKFMSMHELSLLKVLLEMFLESDGDLPDKRVFKTLKLISETIEDSK